MSTTPSAACRTTTRRISAATSGSVRSARALYPTDWPRVLLIDEIDKGDLDLPNDLLNVLEDGFFEIPELARAKHRRGRGEGSRHGERAPITAGRAQQAVPVHRHDQQRRARVSGAVPASVHPGHHPAAALRRIEGDCQRAHRVAPRARAGGIARHDDRELSAPCARPRTWRPISCSTPRSWCSVMDGRAAARSHPESSREHGDVQAARQATLDDGVDLMRLARHATRGARRSTYVTCSTRCGLRRGLTDRTARRSPLS